MHDVEPYPFRTEPYMRVKVWGGRKLPEVFGKSMPADADDETPIGEAWEVADLDEGESHVATGPLEGEPLSRLVDLWGEDLIGTDAPSDDFPLLVKLLDAADDLSVQVHPSEEDVATIFPEADSKDECWIILDVDEGGSILHGVRDGVDAEEFRRAVDEGRAAELLRRVDVDPGQIVRVVPGTIHAICSGVSLLEIQQPSDTTYRVYDYNRPGLDGEPRELHLDEAMQVANFGGQPPTSLEGEPVEYDGAMVDVLVDVPSYRIERVRPNDAFDWRVDPRSAQVVFALRGGVEIRSGEGHSLQLESGESAVLPAAAGSVGANPLHEDTELIVAGIGGDTLLKR